MTLEYITVAEAASRLARYTGITVPSSTETGSPPSIPLQGYIQDASERIAARLGYPYLETTYTDALEGKVTLDKTGHGQITICDATLFPLTAVAAITAPDGAQWLGSSPELTGLQWNSGGEIWVSPLHDLVPVESEWENPLTSGGFKSWQNRPDPMRLQDYKWYPDFVQVDFTAGHAEAPNVFKQAVVALILEELLDEASSTRVADGKRIKQVSQTGITYEYGQQREGEAYQLPPKVEAMLRPYIRDY